MALLYRQSLLPPFTFAINIQVAGLPSTDLPIALGTPALAGSVVGAITVTTNNGNPYSGVITLSGTNATWFALSNSGTYPCNLLVDATTNIPVGTYSISLTANP